jgi:hypothetical protein
LLTRIFFHFYISHFKILREDGLNFRATIEWRETPKYTLSIVSLLIFHKINKIWRDYHFIVETSSHSSKKKCISLSPKPFICNTLECWQFCTNQNYYRKVLSFLLRREFVSLKLKYWRDKWISFSILKEYHLLFHLNEWREFWMNWIALNSRDSKNTLKQNWPFSLVINKPHISNFQSENQDRYSIQKVIYWNV